jgi:Leucine-rich repeat (LRR) protein
MHACTHAAISFLEICPLLLLLLQVKHLSLHFNALTSLPSGIAGCEGLVWLSLNANRITGLPEEICSMTALARLSLHINQVGSVS